MSCPSNQNPVRLSVAMGSLPEGFCGTPQQLGDAIAARLIVTPDQNNATFVSGSVAPISNVGPWLKNCTDWFIFDDATGTYIPITKGGFTNEQIFNASGNFTVPAFIYKLRISAWGGGGGGGDANAQGAGGGGGGFVRGIFNVIPFQVIPFVVGAAGAVGSPGTNGGNTTVLTMVAGGGVGGTVDSVANHGGPGGTANGGSINFRGQGGSGTIAGNGGIGGASPQGGGGGMFALTAGINGVQIGVFPGGGGAGGAGSETAGAGAIGACLFEW